MRWPWGYPPSKNLEDRRGESAEDKEKARRKSEIEEEFQGEIERAPYWTGERGEWDAPHPQEAALDQQTRLHELARSRR